MPMPSHRRYRSAWWLVLAVLMALPLAWRAAAQGGSPDMRIDTTSLAFMPVANRQIFVELDWMESSGGGAHSHKPSQQVIDTIVATFAREGFTITIDVSNAIPEQTPLAIVGSGPSASPDVQALKTAYFDHKNDSRYFYSIWAHNYTYNGSFTTSSGISDLPGGTHIVSLGSFSGQVGTFSNQVGTFIHEFGHNMGQLHGGTDNTNYKPNYASIMNYFYQLDGVGPSMVALGFANTSSGFNTFGYSHGLLPNLNEGALDENAGIGLGRAVDWNCDSTISSPVAKFIHAASRCSTSGTLTTITDFDNWGSINGYVMTGIAPPIAASQVPELCVTPEENQPIHDAVEGLRAQGVLPAENALVAEPGAAADASGAGGHYFDVTNDGSATLIVTGISVDAPASWISWEPQSFTVAPGQTQRVQVYVNFAAMPPVQTTRRLLVASNDPDESPYPNGVYVISGLPTPSIADLNDDSTSDLLFESTTGSLNAWYLNGFTRTGGEFLSPSGVDPNLLVTGMRDFTGDGRPDLLLQNQQNGAVAFYAMNHVSKTGEQSLPIAPNTPWQLVATGDMNNDGFADILWENFSVGQIYVWFMKPLNGGIGYGGAGGTFSGDYVRSAGQPVMLGTTTLRVVGTGDVNGDGRADIILQDDVVGTLKVWLMTGITRTSEADPSPGAVNPAWKVRAVADYNNDQRPDLLFQNPSTGALYLWLMNGLTLGYNGYLSSPAVNPAWQVVGPR